MSSSAPTMTTLARETQRTRQRALVFLLTYCSYAGLHMVRKAVANVKHDLHEIGLSKPFLGTLDTLFLASYAIGLYISGSLGDRLNVKRVLVVGMLLTALLTALFGFAGFVHSSPRLFAILWCLNGLTQSVGWPLTVKIMGNWFGQGHRGAVFGLWASCVSVGNIAGGLLASAVLHWGLGWQWVFIGPSFVVAFAALAVQFFVAPDPDAIGLSDLPVVLDSASSSSSNMSFVMQATNVTPGFDPSSSSTLHSKPPVTPRSLRSSTGVDKSINTTAASKPITFFSAWLIPGVAPFAVTNAFTKMVAYSLLLWLPLYLTEALQAHEAIADLLSTLFDVGGVVGGIVFGIFSDWALKRNAGRSLVIMPILLFSSLTLAMFLWFGHSSLAVNGVLMLLTGLFTNSAYNLINSAVAADLGSQPLLLGNAKAISSVTGIIDGSGSVGAAVGQPLLAWIVETTSWNGMFVFLVCASLLSAACLSGVVWADFGAWRRAGLTTTTNRDPKVS